MPSIQIGVSNRLRGIVAVVHGLAGVAVWRVVDVLWLQLSIMAALMISAAWYDQIMRHPAICEIEGDKDGYRILLQHVWQSAEMKEALITAPLTVIHFQYAGKGRNVVLMADNVETQAYRQFRVWLRWGQIKKPELL